MGAEQVLMFEIFLGIGLSLLLMWMIWLILSRFTHIRSRNIIRISTAVALTSDIAMFNYLLEIKSDLDIIIFSILLVGIMSFVAGTYYETLTQLNKRSKKK